MKSSHLITGLILLLISATSLAPVAFADPPAAQYETKYVFVTGSNIPQKVKVKRIGTKTVSPVTVIGRKDIYRSGRYTIGDVLRSEDPSVQVISGRPGPGF